MPVPTYEELMLPILQSLRDGSIMSNQAIMDQMARRFDLTPDELAVRTPSRGQTLLHNRASWALTYLARAGLLVRPRRAHAQITDAGLSLLGQDKDQLTTRMLRQYPMFVQFEQDKRTGGSRKTQASVPETADQAMAKTPDEMIDAASCTLRDSLADDILERVSACSPSFFEQLVVDVLVAMGYGGSREDAGTAIGRSGDGGIDGTFKEDRLGLDVVCIQAKRWQGTVGRPVVQAFVGSMEGRKATKGVLITTPYFSREAEEYVDQIQRRTVLVDGRQLAQLMIDHDVGVTTARTYRVKRPDSDYFATDGGWVQRRRNELLRVLVNALRGGVSPGQVRRPGAAVTSESSLQHEVPAAVEYSELLLG